MQWEHPTVRLVRRSELRRLLPTHESAALTYPDVGATQGQLPDGYRHLHRRTRLGTGDRAFRRASDALMSWHMHRDSGLAVVGDGPASVHRTVVLAVGRPWCLVVPCRVVYVVDEPNRRGFAYGTLPDHPERGEESFIVTRDANDEVWFEITAFSRPASALTRYSGVLGRVLLMRTIRRYEATLVRLSA
jgi:uncharacterized protein (UPF0548 family)